MTDDPAEIQAGAQGEAPSPPNKPVVNRRRRWPWVLLVVLGVLFAVLAFLPTLFGGLLLSQFGKSAGITADSVQGPLWSPQLNGAKLNLPGVGVTAGSAGVSVASVNPITKTIRLNVRVSDATVKLNLKQLLSGKGGAGAGGNGWKVILSGLDVRDTRVNVNGQGANIPDGQFRVEPGQNGQLAVRGQTPDGALNADVQVREGGSANVITVDLKADATVINHYWPGMTAGTITGRYVLGDGPVRGDLKIADAALRVPGAHFVTVTGIHGNALHRGDSISLSLAGLGWDGPVTAKGGVDLKAQNWTVTTNATPTVSGLARALGTSGEGNIKLRVTAGGWSTVRVKGYVQGAGKFAGIGFSDANVEYTFLNRSGDKAAQTNDIAFSVKTALGGSAQKLQGQWAFNRKGQATLVGALASKPLNMAATIDAHNLVTLKGAALGGPASGTFDLKGAKINALLHPDYGAAKAEVVLRGTPGDLRASVRNGTAGPFPLSGTARLNKDGLQADLGALNLDLNREFKGHWQAQGLKGAGLTLSGSGSLDLTGGTLRGNLSALVPGVDGALNGPLDVNYLKQRGTFTAGAQRLTWNSQNFGVMARDLRVAGGLRVTGDVTVNTALQAFGTLTAQGNGFNLVATGRGSAADLRGTANGVTVLANTQLRAPFNTTARLQGADIQGVLSVQDGIRFTLNTAGETARGVINGQNWKATGRVNLAALRPLVNVKDLSGTLELNLAGLGGTAQVNAKAFGAGVTGTLFRAGGPINADLNVVYSGIKARMSGRVYPQVQAAGTVSTQGQTLQATLSGPYGNLQATARGRTGELFFSGVTIPAQAVNLRGSLTPKLAVSGRWGDLNVTYDGSTGLVRVVGRQTLTAFGKNGAVQGRATWGPGQGGTFRGAVEARGVLDIYRLTASGPWDALNVLVTDAEGLHAQGTASLPEGRYNVRVRGPVAGGTQAGGLFVDGNIQGRGTEPRGRLNVLDGLGGSAVVDLRSLKDFDVQALGLRLGGQPIRGTLAARGTVLNGALTVGPLKLTARNGFIHATGLLAGQNVDLSGNVTLPSTITNLNLKVNGPYFTAQARGVLNNLRGTLTLKRQQFGSDPARVSIPAQSYPLRGSLAGLRFSVGGLAYRSGQFSGSLNARYDLSGRGGTLQLLGASGGLAALPSGPVAGRLELLPKFGGTLTANLSPFTPLLPPQMRQELTPGLLVAQVSMTGATLGTRQTLYLGEPLGLNARLGWKNGFTAYGTLTHPGSRIPVRFDGKNLSIVGAQLSARALQPVLPGAQGEATLNLNVPYLKFEQASGQARVNLSAQGQQAVGLVRLSRGQLSANLTSTLSGLPVRVIGPLYPQANAQLAVDGVRATLVGNTQQTLTLSAAGTYQGRELDVVAVASGLTGGAANISLNGVVEGAALSAQLQQGRGSGLAAWRTTGTVSVPDLRPLANTAGRVNATVSGTLADLRLNASGEVAGVNFSTPATYRNGKLFVQNGSAQLAQGRVIASGAVYPKLNLTAKATLTDLLPGTYRAQVQGTFSKLDVSAQGVLTGGVSGVQAGGTKLSVRLLGKDWRVNFAGTPINGYARGQLNANALGGLLDSRLTLHTRYLNGETNVRVDGPLGWNARRGWGGNLRVRGDIPGGPMDAVTEGHGALQFSGLVGTGVKQARISGSLPADLPFKPGGAVDLAAFDVGALWGRADQLRLTGRATLTGAKWSAPAATFAGKVQDSQDELSGDLGATYRAGNLSVRLSGPHVAGGGTLVGGRYAANLRADSVHLARLLPQDMGVDALTFAGTVQAQGTLAGGPEQLRLQNVALRGQQAQAGPFSLYGSATYTPDTLQAALSGSLRGGVISAQGQLPQGVRVTVRNLNTDYVGAASFGKGWADADLTLRGPLRNPLVEGTANLTTDALDAFAALSGRLLDPRANARITLRGANSGTLYADARDIDLKAGTARAKVYGTVRSGTNLANVNLEGVWPKMLGTVQASLDSLKQPITLTGDGRGNYALSSTELGRGNLRLLGGKGFLPDVVGNVNLTPLPLVNGTGALNVIGTLSGTLAAPILNANVISHNAVLYGVKLADTTGTIGGPLSNLTGMLMQGRSEVATLKGQTVTLNELQAEFGGNRVQATGEVKLSGAASLNLSASGSVSGDLKAVYQARALSVQGNLTGPQSLKAAVDVKADPLTGWHGNLRLTGGPNGVLTEAGAFKLSGPFAHPLVTGEAGLLGAGARLIVNANGVQLRLVDGPTASASGVAEIRPNAAGEWRWSGAVSLSRPELSLSVTPSGPVGDPSLLLSVRRGEWRASGTASLKTADLNVTDGDKSGTLLWRQGQISANLPGLNLARLGLSEVSGLVSGEGSVSTDTQSGQVRLSISELDTPYEVPYLGVRLEGEVNATVTLSGGKPLVQGQLALPSGALKLSAAQGAQHWAGRATGTIRREAGTLDVNVGASDTGLNGTLTFKAYPVNAAGQNLTVNGTLNLNGQSFESALTAASQVGSASVDASGGVADVLPALAGPLAVKPTGEGYAIHAVLNELEVQDLKIAPKLSGRVSGQANISDGGGTFNFASDALKVGAKTLKVYLGGTQAGGDWSIRGYLGEGEQNGSEFRAGLSGGEVSGQGTLRALPISALIAAFAGTTPGEGVVTGVVRFRFPLADPTAGTATIVAERIRVTATSGEGTSATTETLTGTGTVDLANREVRSVNVQLSGAGTWDIQGQYTHQNVNLNAKFTDTTFTPVLQLVPALADLNTSLKGSLTLSAAGTYERPRGLLRAQNVTGTVAGLSLQVPQFSGDLPDSGAFTGGGQVLTGGSVGSNGQVTVKGQLTLGKLSGTVVNFSGLLAPQALGALPNTTASITQSGENRWILDLQSRSTNPTSGAGSLSLTGALSPAWDLTLTARNYNLPLSVIYGRESALNADLRAVDDGTLIHVTGAADFQRLTLGRVNAPNVLPAPGQTTSDNGGQVKRATDNYASPLPEQYTTFPTAGQDAQATARVSLPLLQRLILENIPIRAPNGIRVDESLVRADFTGNLTLSGTGAKPKLSGDIRAQRGFIYLRENQFTLSDTSIVTFNGESLYPKFDVTASGTVPSASTNQNVPVTVNMQGQFVTRNTGDTVLDLTTTLSCTVQDASCTDPATATVYTEPELYALVATGVPNLTTLPNNLTTLGSSALKTAVNLYVLGAFERTIAKAFGLDVFRFAPDISTTDGSFSATLTVGSYLTRNFYVQYQVDLTGKGLLDATYNTPDNRFTFKVSTPLQGLDLTSIKPNFSAAYNLNLRTSVSIGVESNTTTGSTKFRVGVTYRFGAR